MVSVSPTVIETAGHEAIGLQRFLSSTVGLPPAEAERAAQRFLRNTVSVIRWSDSREDAERRLRGAGVWLVENDSPATPGAGEQTSLDHTLDTIIGEGHAHALTERGITRAIADRLLAVSVAIDWDSPEYD